MEERREKKRSRMLDTTSVKANVKQYFRVFSRDSDKFLGYLMDISSKGAMLLSTSAISEDQELRLRIELPEEILGSNELLLTCKSIWCKRAANPEYYRIGLAFVETSPDLDDKIKSLVEGTTRPKSVGLK